MLKTHIHYEAAFEHYLRGRQIPCVAVDEAKKSVFRDAKLKSFDFIVYSDGATNWLVDVKGRRWVSRQANRKPTWENWVTEDDLTGLLQWQQVFGSEFRGLLVFAYWLQPGPDPPAEIVHVYANERYVFAGVPADEYRLHARVRSPKWGTVNMPTAEFARHVRPLADWL
ncbi:MAG: HYExAFE family protein [Planctomycetes bacterium]|nr:HYExAFE family protein [Planctomycetota bacterium]